MPSLSKNKKAFHDYEILDTYEAGIVLLGPEVKSCKASNCNLKGSYVDIDSKHEVWMNEAHISPYKFANKNNPDPTRKRKLLLNEREILKILKILNETGVTCVPLEMYTKAGMIKVKIGLVKGKKLYDKRADLKKKSQDIDIARALKRK